MNLVESTRLSPAQKSTFSKLFYNSCGFDDRGYVSVPWGCPWLWGTTVIVDISNLQKSAEQLYWDYADEISDYLNN